MTGTTAARERMVREQIAARGIEDPAILDAFRAIPREMFLSADMAHLAYGDHPLPIEAGQTISQPYIVALMIAEAGVGPDSAVLEVGAGSGYAAAILGRIARKVVAIERHSELAGLAAGRIAALGLGNVAIVTGDGTLGWPADAPFDSILAAASGPRPPAALLDQLAPDGTLVMPVGDPNGVQQLVRIRRGPDGRLVADEVCAVRFVPLVGAG